MHIVALAWSLLAALPSFGHLQSYVIMILGFGFVIFFHELGHFLAAKAVGIKVEQFAVGFGHAMVAWRKGIGFRFGSTQKRYAEIQKTAEEQGPESVTALSKNVGETEYRINWIPLGGYVKMLGQDDLKPGEQVLDPRAFSAKSVGARMIVVSAGVIMNILLAAIGFIILFTVGFNAPPPVVGTVNAFSPAQRAGLQPGDRVGTVNAFTPAQQPGLQPGDRLVSINGYSTHDWMGVILYTALVRRDQTVPVVVERPNSIGGYDQLTLYVKPQRPAGGNEFQAIGVTPSESMHPPDADALADEQKSGLQTLNPTDVLKAGERITSVNGQAVSATEHYKLTHALQQGDIKPVTITITASDGKTREVTLPPVFDPTIFSEDDPNIAGMEMQPLVSAVLPDAPATHKLEPGDTVQSVVIDNNNGDRVFYPTPRKLIEQLNRAHDSHATVTLEVLRAKPDGSHEKVVLEKLEPSYLTGKNRHGLGISLMSPGDRQPVIADVLKGSPVAAASGASLSGALIEKVDDQAVPNWFTVRRALMKAGGHTLSVRLPDTNEVRSVKVNLSEADVNRLQDMRLTAELNCEEFLEMRKTSNLATAALWGVQETRDFVLQFYVTLERMVQGDISVKNVMGPIGMAKAGAGFARKGPTWLIWFLAMISANLAVVNFLPIPVVDGGLFTFLIIEKIKGSPLSVRTQTIAQVVGLVLIVAVFLLVSYQDITRNLGI